MRRRGRPEDGFLLVGVVMFILALTILGISLYSLSSYEADFQMQSRDANSAFYRAQGGLLMAQEALAAPTYNYQLDAAGRAVGFRGVTSAIAQQRRPDGSWVQSGAINWDSTVTITVAAASNGVTRTLRATFRPQPRDEYYKRLATVSEYFHANHPALGSDGKSDLYGQIWDGGDALADSQLIVSRNDPWSVPAGTRRLKTGAVALPDLPAYYAMHPLPSPPTSADTTGSPWEYHLVQAGPQPRYFWNPRDAARFHPFPSLKIEVHGTVVWMLPHGLYCVAGASVRGSGTLVVVAQRNNMDAATVDYYNNHYTPALGLDLSDADVGIYFQGGLDVDHDVNVILVSDDRVKIEQQNNYGNSMQAGRISIFARSFDCYGPQPATAWQYLHHPVDMDAAIDALPMDVLPRPASGPNNGFALVPGSWRDLTP